MRHSLPLALLLAACNGGDVLVYPDDVVDDVADVDTDTDRIAPCEPLPAAEGPYIESVVVTDVARCEASLNAFAGPVGATMRIGIDATHDADTWLTLMQVDGTVLDEQAVRSGEDVTFELPWSGEFLVEARPVDDAASQLSVSVQCDDGCDTPWTRYPLVFLHGMAGTDTFVGVLDYWLGVEDDLTSLGYEVHVGAVDPFQTTPVRAEQWVEQLDQLVALGRHRRVNLVAHSQGGLDARYLATHLDPEHRVHSVTTVATPHHGTAIADVISGTLHDARITRALLDGLFDGIGRLYGMSDQDIVGQMDQHTAAAMVTFNAEVPDRRDVLYASFSARTCGALEWGCQRDNGGEIVHPAFAASYRIIQWLDGPNDGVIPVHSAEWGIVRDELSADHLDEIGLFLGIDAPGFDHIDLYREHAEWLGEQGL